MARTIYLNEKLNVVLIPHAGIGRWLCKAVTVELAEMNTLIINGTFYKRDKEVCGLLRLHLIENQEEELQMLAEEVLYHRRGQEELSCACVS